MKHVVQIIAGILMLGISSTTFSSSLVFKNRGVAVFAVAGNTLVWMAKPPIHENSNGSAGQQGLAIKRSGELRLWTNQDNVYIPGIVVALPNPVPSQSLAFNSEANPKTTIYPAPQSGAPALGTGNGVDDPTNLSSQDMYLENHVIANDLFNNTMNEYCNYGEGRIEFDPENGNRKLFNHKDHLGSTRAVEAEDGSAVERVVYDAYGAVVENEMSGVEKAGKDKFTGKELDDEGGSQGGVSVIRLNLRVSEIPDELTEKSVYVTLWDGTIYEFGLERNTADNSYFLQNDIEVSGGTELKAIKISILYNNPNKTEYSVGVDPGCGFNATIPWGKIQQVNFDEPFTNTAVFTLGSHHKDCDNRSTYFELLTQTWNRIASGIKLFYFGKRYYDSEIGRWIGIDKSKQYFDFYAYAGNGTNPISGIDANGKRLKFAEGVDPTFKNEFHRAVTYLNNHEAAEVLAELEDRPEIIYISRGDENSFSKKDNAIKWNPNISQLTSSGWQSPALALVHEVGHALDFLLNPKNYRMRQLFEGASGNPNLVEQSAVEDYENPAARKLEEPQRKDYDDVAAEKVVEHADER